MAKLKEYNIPLKDVSNEGSVFYFKLDNKTFFSKLEDAEITNGEIDAKLVLTKRASFFHLDFVLIGDVEVICDRCLDTMTLNLEINETLEVKLGLEYAEEEDYIIIPEAERQINVAWLMYEFIALNIPLQHFHDENECDKEMLSKLNNLIVNDIDEEIDNETQSRNNKTNTDPRWDRLKDILENN